MTTLTTTNFFQMLENLLPGEVADLEITYEAYMLLKSKNDSPVEIIDVYHHEKLLELANDESLEELMKTDFEKFKNKILYYTALDQIVDINKISDMNYDAVGMVLSALQYHVYEGGLKSVTYSIIPPIFKFNIKVMKKKT